MESHILSLVVVIKLACRLRPVEQLASVNENIPRRKTCDHFMMLERRRTITDRHDLTYETTKLQGKSPGANGGSVQRLASLVRPNTLNQVSPSNSQGSSV